MNIKKLAYLCEIIGALLELFSLFYVLFSVCWELGTIVLGAGLFLIGYCCEQIDKKENYGKNECNRKGL